MIDYKTDTRQAHTQGGDNGSISPEELLIKNRSYYYKLVDKIFGDEPKGRTKAKKELQGLSVYDLMAMYAVMRTSREIDHMQGLLQRTGNLWFSIAGAGKEVMNVAIAHHMRPDDAKLPYYRDQALALWSGIRMLDITRQSVASRFDPMSGGRQMSSHFGSVDFNFPTGSTMTGSQFLPAAGYGEGLKLERKLGKALSIGAKAGKNDSF
ncbi:MAG: thiamine pyrophosphate-dependent enzyme, partial [Chloroflexota bacterium]